MNLKKAIAREWLLFLLVFILSPMIVAVYHWTETPKTSEDFLYENPRIYDLVILAPGYDSQFRVDSSLPKVERNQTILKFVAEHPLKKDVVPESCKGDIFDKLACKDKGRSVLQGEDIPKGFVLLSDFIPDSPKDGLVEIGQYVDGYYLGNDSRKLLEGIRGNGFLTLKKRSLIGYVAAVVVSPARYYGFIIIYPLFLFLRSIIWSIRKIKES
jgi:hypothetical protein